MLNDFFLSQIKDWDLAYNNYQALQLVKTKSFLFDGFEIKVQYNPARIQSTNAKTDSQEQQISLCPLCRENRSDEQKSIPFLDLFSVMVNPYPIFDRHFTIAYNQHSQQYLKGFSFFLLNFARRYPNYLVFYNGPRSGASLPNHLHLQAIPKGNLPVEKDVLLLKKKPLIIDKLGSSYYLCNYLRMCIVLESVSDIWLMSYLEHTLWKHLSVNSNEEEPMMNVIVSYDRETKVWRLFVFPRKKHRPTQFYEQGNNRLLISPGTIDMGGVLIVPREEDFNKITKDIIQDIYNQISL
ncbi:DUF4922 domain-containing protein [Bacteroidales bacterium OttesenSCG-928-M11]|nr:DUF4922 domain-containing protein [Bacteroidales bacterium OttesenSCG-928-M11]